MKKTFIILMALLWGASVWAAVFNYQFRSTRLSDALATIAEEHPALNINFIYNELDKYRTSAAIDTDNPLDALRQLVGFNPVSVIRKGNRYYIEALQHGRYVYTGTVTETDNEPVEAATVMLLAPRDSSVVTYGITDSNGRFTIPCDAADVLGKVSCLGYKTVFKRFESMAVGTIIIEKHAVALEALNVDAPDAYLYADKSVYIPTTRQKNSSQTAADLLDRMAIPQLRIGEATKTVNGQPVEMYIDFVPASNADLEGLLVSDVKRVEYYDYPIDPRFQGQPHVVNFIMQQYQYGGYVKGIGYENFVASRQVNGFAKLQYKNMTYDWAGGVYNKNDSRNKKNSYETFRLPQADGTIKEFERSTIVHNTRDRNNVFWSSLKALYRSDKATISNMITGDFDRTPSKTSSGTVAYNPADFEDSDFASRNWRRVNSFVYSGYWYFSLPHGNSINFVPYYGYTHTRQISSYIEGGFSPIFNGAVDDSHQFLGNLAFDHSFGSGGSLQALCTARFYQNRTCYSGTSSLSDLARTYRVGPTVKYSYSNDKLYTTAGLGLDWDRSVYGTISENSAAPRATFSVQYAFNAKNSLSADFSYSKSIPSANYRSASVVQSDPFMSYTGNPALVPYDSYQLEAEYSFIPSKKFSLSAYGWEWIVGNRYVYFYEAGPEGILRTIKQPMGSFNQLQCGLQGSTRLLSDNLRLSAAFTLFQAHNGEPYNWNKAWVVCTLNANYYLGNVYFGASYNTPFGYPDGCMTGEWMSPRSGYVFHAGWSNRHWNLRFFTRNFLRYNTWETRGVMNSTHYDRVQYTYAASHAGFFQLSATYTFSFGKKVRASEEAYQASGAGSGILK